MHYTRFYRHGDPLAKKVDGRKLHPNGYVLVRVPGHPTAQANGYAFEHRVVLDDLGIDVAGLEVHHRNGDKRDNRPENLEVVSRSDHARLHTRGLIKNQFGIWPRRFCRDWT